jgi:hypothetical protein
LPFDFELRLSEHPLYQLSSLALVVINNIIH